MHDIYIMRKDKLKKKHKQQYISNPGFYLFSGSLILILPLIYNTSGLDPSLAPRLLGLNIILLVSATALLLSPVWKKTDHSILRSPLLILLLAYAVVTGISMFFSINYKEGFFDLNKSLSMVILTAMAGIIFSQTPRWYDKLTRLVFFGAVIALIIGFNDYAKEVLLSPNKLLPDGRPVVYRVTGLMAHKNQFAISLMLMVPFTVYGIFRFKSGWRILYGLITALLMLLLVLIETRSAWVGILLGGATVVLVMSMANKSFGISTRIRNLILAGSVFAVVALAGAAALSGRAESGSMLGRLESIIDPGHGNNVYRLKIWNITTGMIADHPVTGVGAGNWKIEIGRYFKGQHFEKKQLNWIRPHNDFLWVFAEKGIIGFLVYIGIFVFAVWMMLALFRSEISREKKWFALLMSGGVVSYLTVSMFSFPLERINQQVYLALMLAGILALYHGLRKHRPQRINRWAVLFPVAVVLVFSISYSISEIKLEKEVKLARQAQFHSDWKTMLVHARRIPTTFRNIDSEAVPVAWYKALALANMNQPRKALAFYQQAVKQHPTRVMVLNNLGKTYIDLGDVANGQLVLQQALDILPDYTVALINLSASYYQQGDYQKALEKLELVRPSERSDMVNNNIRALRRKIKASTK